MKFTKQEEVAIDATAGIVTHQWHGDYFHDMRGELYLFMVEEYRTIASYRRVAGGRSKLYKALRNHAYKYAETVKRFKQPHLYIYDDSFVPYVLAKLHSEEESRTKSYILEHPSSKAIVSYLESYPDFNREATAREFQMVGNTLKRHVNNCMLTALDEFYMDMPNDWNTEDSDY